MKWYELLIAVMNGMSPEFRAFLKAQLDAMEAKAKETNSPWDDVGVKLLRIVTGL
jgi:hypothetical protein